MRGGDLIIGEGRVERQSKERGCKRCKEVASVKSTFESILHPTFRDGREQHGRSRVQPDQYGLLKAVQVGQSPISHSFSEEKFPFASCAFSPRESLERLQPRLLRLDRRRGRPSLAWPSPAELGLPRTCNYHIGVEWVSAVGM